MKNVEINPVEHAIKLGRLYSKDDRDFNHLIPRKLVHPSIRRKFYPTGRVLDQGYTPMCVEYAGVQFLRTGPVFNKVALSR